MCSFVVLCGARERRLLMNSRLMSLIYSALEPCVVCSSPSNNSPTRFFLTVGQRCILHFALSRVFLGTHVLPFVSFCRCLRFFCDYVLGGTPRRRFDCREVCICHWCLADVMGLKCVAGNSWQALLLRLWVALSAVAASARPCS